VDRDAQARLLSLESRLALLEGENKTLTFACAKLREQHDALTNLYAAEHRLRETRDVEVLLSRASEVLVDHLGVETFTVFALDAEGGGLTRVSGLGDEHAVDDVPLGARMLSMVAQNGKPFYYESSAEASRRGGVPLVAIPIKRLGEPVGVLAVFRLDSEKKGLTLVEHHLLDVVAEHIAPAVRVPELHELDKGA
jgi:hypothetical protein